MISISRKFNQLIKIYLIIIISISILFMKNAFCQDDKSRTLTIVSLNALTHNSHKNVPWKKRLNNFVDDIVERHHPAIIGFQELYLLSKNAWGSSQVAEISRGEYLRYLLNRIEVRTGIKYNVATTLRTGHALFGTWAVFVFAEEWEGDGVIYDPAQIRLIPFNEDNGHGRECENWAQDRLQESLNDCCPLSRKGDTKVSKSVFEFPKGSDNYILFYNVHCNKERENNYIQINEAVNFIVDRHENFYYNKYPPIFVGDFNRGSHPKFDYYFDDPIGSKKIDKVLVGKSYRWITQSDRAPRRGPAWQVLEARSINDHVYSDHPAALVKLKAPTIVPELIEHRIPIDLKKLNMVQTNAGWEIFEGNRRLFNFGYAFTEAQMTYLILKHYNINQLCYVGRPNSSFEYILSSNKAPSGLFPNEDCISFSPNQLEVKKIKGSWKIVHANSWLFDFGWKYNEAKKALTIIKKYGFTKTCSVGRPDPSFKYFRK